MKTLFLTFVSLCLLATNAGANDFSTTDVTSGVGVVAHIYGDWPNYESILDQVQATGARVARIDFIWNMIEGTQGQYDFSGYDNVVAACEARGIRIYANLLYANPLYGDGIPESDPAYFGTQSFRDGFTNYAMATVNHFKTTNPGVVTTWEVWNEPNYGFWPGQDANQYMALANQVLPLIRTADPTATIAGPSLSASPITDNYQYLTDCFNYGNANPGTGLKGLLDLVDGVSVHPYRWDGNRNPESLVTDTAQFNYADLRTLMNDTTRWANGSNVEIIDSEMGYTTTWSGMTLQTQADYVSRMLLVDASQDIPLTIMYDLIDDGTDPNNGEHHFGLLYNDLTPKPAFYAMQTLTSNLKGKTYNASANVNDGYAADYILAFTNADGRKTYAAWTTGNPATRSSISLAGGTIRAYLTGTPMYLGEVQQLQDTGTATWSTATWGNSMDGVNGGWVPGSQAKFATTNQTINVDKNFDLSGIQFTASGIKVNSTGGGALVLGSGGGIISNTGIANIGANIIGGGESAAACQVVKTGTGQLTLGGENSFLGNFIIAQGSVLLNNARALAGPVVTLRSTTTNRLQFASGIPDFYLGGLAGNQSLNIGTHNLYIGESNLSNDADGVGYSGDLRGTGSIVKNGTGTMLFSRANTYTGTTTINGGTLTMGIDAKVFGNTTSTITLAGGCLDMNGFSSKSTNSLSRAISITGTSGLSNTNTDATSTYSGIISDGATSGSLTKYGAGVLTLSGANTYTGETTINAGTLKLGDAHVLGNPSAGNETIVLNGGGLDFWGWSTPGQGAYYSADLNRAMTVTPKGGALVNTDTNNAVYSPDIMAYGSFVVDTASQINLRGAVASADPGIYGWSNIKKTGTGTLVFDGNTDNHLLTVVAAEGTTILAKENTSATGTHAAVALVVSAGATVQFAGSGNYQLDPAFGYWVNVDGGTIDFNGRSQIGTSLNNLSAGSTLANMATGTTSTYRPSGVETISKNFNVNTVGDLHLTAGLGCDPTVRPQLSKIGSGTLYLDGNTDNACLTVLANEGTTVLAKENTSAAGIHAATALAVASGATVQYAGSGDYQLAPNAGYWVNMNGGTIDFNGRNQTGTDLAINTDGSTLANTAAGTTSTFSPSTATLNASLTANAVGNLTVNGSISGSGSVIKNGTGALTLTSANSYNGATTVNSGSLVLSGSGRINTTSGITLNSGGTLFQNNTTTPMTAPIAFSGGTLGGSGAYNGNLSVGNGHLSPGATGVGSIGTLTIGGVGNLTLTSSSVLDFDFGATAGVCDWLTVTGDLTLDGTLNITSSDALVHGKYTLFSVYGATGVTDNGLDFGVVPAGHNWAYAIANDNGVYSVIVTAAPEPGTLILLATGLLGILAYAWRKQR